MELTRTDAVFSRLSMVLFMCRNRSSRNDLKLHGTSFWKILKILEEKSTSGGPHPVHEGGGAPVPLGAPPTSWAPWRSTDLNSNSIYSLSGRKKSERRIHRVLQYGAAAPLKPLRRADLKSVRGSGEGNLSPSSSSTILHQQFHDAHRRA